MCSSESLLVFALRTRDYLLFAERLGARGHRLGVSSWEAGRGSSLEIQG